jgi:hypothetical protein
MGYTGYIVLWTMLSITIHQQARHPTETISLNYRDYWVSPRTTYEDFRLRIFNNGDQPVTIDKALPSCGCVLVTIQKNRATRSHPGEIYIAIVSKTVDPLQPVTVDIYTSENPHTPKRVYIRRAPQTRLQ